MTKVNDLFDAIEQKNTEKIIEIMVNELPRLPEQLKMLQQLVEQKCGACEAKSKECEQKFENLAKCLRDLAGAVDAVNTNAVVEQKNKKKDIYKMVVVATLVGILLIIVQVFGIEVDWKTLMSLFSYIATV